MMHVRSGDLRSVIRPSIFLATVGVVIATLVGGFVLWKLVRVPESTAFLFAAIIAPTDAATVLEIFRRARVPSKLSTLMETEAAFNDATGIVIFALLTQYLGLTGVPILFAVKSFWIVFGGGALIGLLVAFVAELLSSLISNRLSETMLTISTVYGSYALASAIKIRESEPLRAYRVSVAGLYFGTSRPALP